MRARAGLIHVTNTKTKPTVAPRWLQFMRLLHPALAGSGTGITISASRLNSNIHLTSSLLKDLRRNLWVTSPESSAEPCIRFGTTAPHFGLEHRTIEARDHQAQRPFDVTGWKKELHGGDAPR